MPRANPLPSPFDSEPFLVRDAIANGLPARRLRARDVAAPFHGVRTTASDVEVDLLSRCRRYAPRLKPDQFFSHATALSLWGVPLPNAPHGAPLHVGAIPPGREPRTAGVIGHRLRIDFADLTLVHGLPVPTVAEAIAQLASMTSVARGSLGVRGDDLIVAIDHVRTSGLATTAQIEQALTRLRRRGAVDLESALAQSRAGAESPKETETRLILNRAGLPEPSLNWELRDADGAFIARLDLAYRAWRVAVEYDGRQHAESVAQFERDADRWASIARADWMLVRVLAHHLRHPERDVVAPVRRALALRGWSPSR